MQLDEKLQESVIADKLQKSLKGEIKMGDLYTAIALLGLGILGAGWLFWSARSPKSKQGKIEGQLNEKWNISNGKDSASFMERKTPNIVAFCREPSTMVLREDVNAVYVTYVVNKKNGTFQGRYGQNN